MASNAPATVTPQNNWAQRNASTGFDVTRVRHESGGAGRGAGAH